MYARTTTVQADPGAIDEGITYLREKVMPSLAGTAGCIGLSMLTDRESGRCIAATAWETEEALSASADGVRPVRNQLVSRLGGEAAEVRAWEIAVVHRLRPAGDHAGAQVTWARIQPNHVDALLDAYRINLMPRLEELPGFCSVSMLVDRRNGRTVSVTCFEDRDAVLQTRKHARSLREQFATAMAAKIVDVGEMDVAIAHLRVPETA